MLPQHHRTTLYLLALLLGLATSQFLPTSATITSSAGGLFLFLTAWQWQKPRLRLMLMCAVLITLGLARSGFIASRVQYLESVVPVGEQTIRGVIVKEVAQQDTGQTLVLDKLQISNQLWSGRMRVYAPLAPTVAYGDAVQLRCEVKKINVDGLWKLIRMRAAGIQGQCSKVSLLRVNDGRQGNAVMQLLLDSKNALIKSASQSLPSPHAELLAGLLLGSKSSLPAVVQEQFRRAGLSHIVALSGYNIAIVVTIAFGLCVRVGLSRRRAFFILLLSTAAFIAATGAESSAVRAGVMAAVALSARMFGRLTAPVILLLSTAAAMAIFRPFIILGDVGFHLSFAATAGLMFGSEFIQNKLWFVPEKFDLRESLATTLSATLATLPIMIFELQRVSLVAIAANVLVGPIIPLTMAVGAAAIGVGMMAPILGVWGGLPAWVLLEYILRVTEFFAGVAWAQIQVQS